MGAEQFETCWHAHPTSYAERHVGRDALRHRSFDSSRWRWESVHRAPRERGPWLICGPRAGPKLSPLPSRAARSATLALLDARLRRADPSITARGLGVGCALEPQAWRSWRSERDGACLVVGGSTAIGSLHYSTPGGAIAARSIRGGVGTLLTAVVAGAAGRAVGFVVGVRWVVRGWRTTSAARGRGGWRGPIGPHSMGMAVPVGRR